MLYNILMVCMIPVVGALVFFSYRQGIKDGRALKEDKEIKPIVVLPKREAKQSEDVKRLNTVLDNINNYNGGPMGQREVR